MTPPSPAERLAEWGVIAVAEDKSKVRMVLRKDVMSTDKGNPVAVRHEGERPSFQAYCADCADYTPHVSPDDGSILLCLECGEDRWA